MLKSDDHSPLTNYTGSEFSEHFKMLKYSEAKESLEHFLKDLNKIFSQNLRKTADFIRSLQFSNNRTVLKKLQSFTLLLCSQHCASAIALRGLPLLCFLQVQIH